MPRRILIVVEGGLIQQIYGIPPDLAIDVHDYDVDAEDEELLERDSNGDLYCGSLWESKDSPPLPEV